jgi:hypothetical protein
MQSFMRKLIFALLMLAGLTGFAQETVSSLNGIIHDEKGAIIQGATVELTHVPTGAVAKTQTNKKGIFSITNLKPGGPYTIAITFVGFKEERAQDVNLTLGNNPDLNIVMKVNTGSLEAVVVSATKKIVMG